MHFIAYLTWLTFDYSISKKIGLSFAAGMSIRLVCSFVKQSMLLLWYLMRIEGFFRVITIDFEVSQCFTFDISLVFVKRLIDFIPAFAE